MMGSMSDASNRRRRWRPSWSALSVLAVGILVLAGISTGNAQDLRKSGTLSIEQVQIAFIGSGNLGGGELNFNGRSYRFKIGGLGIGGIGVSKIHARGFVYNMTDVAQFPGPYLQARRGFAVGDLSGGVLWLENGRGVVLGLKAEREGLALALGGDAIYIKFE